MSTRGQTLPPTLSPRGLSRYQAAAYLSISATKFDQMVDAGQMPRARKIGSRLVWDRFELDLAFDDLPRDADEKTPAGEDDPWDDLRV